MRETVWICPRADDCNREGVGRYCRCSTPHHFKRKCPISGNNTPGMVKARWCPDCVEVPNIVMVEEEICLTPNPA